MDPAIITLCVLAVAAFLFITELIYLYTVCLIILYYQMLVNSIL